MTRVALLLLTGLLAVSCHQSPKRASGSATPEKGLRLLFIANEGVMLSAGSQKILIDALFTRPNPEYTAPPPEMLESMEVGKPPFEEVNVVFVTHHHPDHYDPALAARFLTNNEQSSLVAPEDAVAALRDLAADHWPSISSRVSAVALSPGERSQQTVNEVTFTAFRTLHSGDRDSPQNLMYLIRLNERSVFHQGDADGDPSTFAPHGLDGEDIDLALVAFWFPLVPEAENVLRHTLDADHIGLIHLPESWKERGPAAIAEVVATYRDLFLLQTPGETRTLR